MIFFKFILFTFKQHCLIYKCIDNFVWICDNVTIPITVETENLRFYETKRANILHFFKNF